MTLSLITKGILCFKNIIITNRYVLPYNLEIRDKSFFNLQIRKKENITLNLSNILDKQVNLKITEEQINIKKNLDDSINFSN